MRPRWTAFGFALACTQGACSYSVRAEGGARSLAGTGAGQGRVGAAVGIAEILVPQVGVGVGSTSHGNVTTNVEVGGEYAGHPAPSTPWSFRAGPSVGFAVAGPAGTYFAAHGGPTYALRHPSPGLAVGVVYLDALVGAGVSGDLSGGLVGGLSLGIGFDTYARVPRGR